MTVKNPNALVGIGGAPTRNTTLPTEAAERKKYPMATGLLDYFPDALAEVAHVSWAGNEQHNPGQPLHWARGKSSDEADTAIRHFSQRGTRDTDGQRHSAKAAWRALAILQKEIEADGVPAAPGRVLGNMAKAADAELDNVLGKSRFYPGAFVDIDNCTGVFYRPENAPIFPTAKKPEGAPKSFAVADQIKEIIAEIAGIILPESITFDSDLRQAYDFDSLDLVELVIGVEEAFDLEISDEEAEKMKTVGDLVLYVQAKV